MAALSAGSQAGQVPPDGFAREVTLWVNGTKRVVPDADPSQTLLEWLRAAGLTGTKLGCGEGGCGACTVMVSAFRAGKIIHTSVNACLAPLCACDHCAVTTIEGIGGIRSGLHPLQRRLASWHGSQCGFCTPGIVMALYALLRTHPSASRDFIEENMDGNLCRCTGYRPILDAAKSFCCGGGGSGEGCACADAGAGGGDGGGSVCTTTADKLAETAPTRLGQDTSEPIFPPELQLATTPGLWISGPTAQWVRPQTLDQMLQLRAQYPESRIVVGNTEVGIEVKFKHQRVDVILSPVAVRELNALQLDQPGNKVVIGGAVTLAAVEHFIVSLEQGEGDLPKHAVRGLTAMRNMMRWFASNQIRNAASLAGNIATASPISDMNPMLCCLDATLEIGHAANGRRQLPIRDFFKGYRKVDLAPGELIVAVHVPLVTSPFEFVEPYKQARRREDDISIVSAGYRVRLTPSPDGQHWLIDDAAFGFGGMAAWTVTARQTMETMAGMVWGGAEPNGSMHSWLLPAFAALAADMPLPRNVPGGQCEFRRSLPPSFMIKFFVSVNQQLQAQLSALSEAERAALPPACALPAAMSSAAINFVTAPKPPTSGCQTYGTGGGGLTHGDRSCQAAPLPACDDAAQAQRAPVGEPLQHMSASKQVTGEALYVDDIPEPPNLLHAALVLSTKAHARITELDTAPALEVARVVSVLTSKDVTGTNHIGAVIKDEEVFASEEVHCVGQVIAVVVAETLAAAQQGARAVRVLYEELPAVCSIEAAVAAGSFYDMCEHEIESGDVDEAVAAAQAEGSDVVTVQGEVRVGGQEHFYLEPNSTLVVPEDAGDELVVYSSTQNPTKTQNFCAFVCGLPAHKVSCRMKRMGGGFGGKETRSVFVGVTAALAAYTLKRPVKITLDRNVDMAITGQRHPFLCHYKAGVNRSTGKLAFLDAHLYSNGGCSLDLSGPILDRALFHTDCCYKWPALRVHGQCCKTNLPSNTAFRGFGGPQGMVATESIMEHLSTASGLPAHDLRMANLYSEGDLTHFGQVLQNWNVPRCLAPLHAKFGERSASVAQFNSEHRFRKRGLALIPTKFGIAFTAKFMNQGGALVHVYADGTILVSHGGTEMGQGLHTKVCQVAARVFGVPIDRVHVCDTATDKVANSSPSAASLSTDLYGMATLIACEEIKARLDVVAKDMPGKSFNEIVHAAYFRRVDLSAHGFYSLPTDRCGYDWSVEVPKGGDPALRGTPFNYFTQGAALTEVEVDCLTGDHRVLSAEVVMDVGNSINPALDIGQIEGAFVQGLGWLTSEELIWGDRDHPWVRPGALFTQGPGTYKIPSFNDTPMDFRVSLLDNANNPFAVHSSKAIGEPPFFLASSAFFAIRSAVAAARADAVVAAEPAAFRFHSPATSERIRMACADNITAGVMGQVAAGDGDASSASHASVAAAFQAKGSW